MKNNKDFKYIQLSCKNNLSYSADFNIWNFFQNSLQMGRNFIFVEYCFPVLTQYYITRFNTKYCLENKKKLKIKH